MAVDFMSLDNYYLELMRQNVSMIRQVNTSIIQTYKSNHKQENSSLSKSNVSSLSETGKEFSTYYQDINKSDNENALIGLKKISLEISKDTKGGSFYGLKDHLESLKASDYDQYIDFFETANTVGNRYHSLGQWLDTYTLMDDSSHQSRFIDLSKDFMSKEVSDYDLKKSFSSFLKEIQKVMMSDNEDLKEEKMNTLLMESKDPIQEKSI